MKCRTSFLRATTLSAFMAYSIGASAQSVHIEGSSAGLTISQAAAAEFHLSNRGTMVSVGLSGSSGALGKLCRGEVDLVHSARPMSKSEIEDCGTAAVRFIELPIAFDAVTVVVNPRNTYVQSLTLAELRAMWEETAQGKIVRWSQISARFPDAPLKLLAPDRQFDGSNYFTAAVLGPGKASRRDYMGSVDDNVLIQGVARDANTLSYLPIATYLDNRAKLRAVPIAASANASAVTPTLETIAGGRYRPLSRPIFLYISERSLAQPAAAAFARFYAANAGRFARETNYVPLTETAYRDARERLRRRVVGSVWNGAMPLGLGPQEMRKRKAL